MAVRSPLPAARRKMATASSARPSRKAVSPSSILAPTEGWGTTTGSLTVLPGAVFDGTNAAHCIVADLEAEEQSRGEEVVDGENARRIRRKTRNPAAAAFPADAEADKMAFSMAFAVGSGAPPGRTSVMPSSMSTPANLSLGDSSASGPTGSSSVKSRVCPQWGQGMRYSSESSPTGKLPLQWGQQ